MTYVSAASGPPAATGGLAWVRLSAAVSVLLVAVACIGIANQSLTVDVRKEFFPELLEEDVGYGDAVSPQQLGVQSLDQTGHEISHDIDHVFAEPGDHGTLWQEPLRAPKKASGVTVKFKKAPFNDLRAFWADDDKPNQIVGEWMAGRVSISNGDSRLAVSIRQGVYVPVVDGKPKPLRLFTQAEAHDCVNGRKIFFAGDSYQIQVLEKHRLKSC